jgi:hypothetical protein
MSCYVEHCVYVNKKDTEFKKHLINNGFELVTKNTIENLDPKDPCYEWAKIGLRHETEYEKTHDWYMIEDYSDSKLEEMIKLSKEMGYRPITSLSSMHRYVIGTCDYELTFENGELVKENFLHDETDLHYYDSDEDDIDEYEN